MTYLGNIHIIPTRSVLRYDCSFFYYRLYCSVACWPAKQYKIMKHFDSSACNTDELCILCSNTEYVEMPMAFLGGRFLYTYVPRVGPTLDQGRS